MLVQIKDCRTSGLQPKGYIFVKVIDYLSFGANSAYYVLNTTRSYIDWWDVVLFLISHVSLVLASSSLLLIVPSIPVSTQNEYKWNLNTFSRRWISFVRQCEPSCDKYTIWNDWFHLENIKHKSLTTLCKEWIKF